MKLVDGTYTLPLIPNVKKLPKWQRSFVINEGELFLPIGMFMSETEGFLCASYDSIQVCEYKKHSYLPVSWMKKEFKNNEAYMKALNHMEEKVEEMEFSEK